MLAQQFSVEDGVLHGATKLPSPNFNQRPQGDDVANKKGEIRLVVIHNISLPPSQFGGGYIQQFFQNQLDSSIHPYFETIKAMQVSAHLLILRTGEVIQFVNFNDRAWHAGRSSYLGQTECNDYSIGIELEGSDDTAFEPVQYDVLAKIILAIEHAYPKTKQHLTGHSDIAPVRKTDPGAFFDWQKLRHLIASLR
ncbi:1,6-anhydro-N-acetylmuramyl-L-alanine amidase AmpD [Acinetobacter sp. c2-A9]|uniref:1,6-anhydro-N-acetylmuramyl-L-alanine amidase AmpD n=1 Tax=Acinetobacter sp. c2-A9 TaxID=3342802 RepID=UPI0035B91BF4